VREKEPGGAQDELPATAWASFYRSEMARGTGDGCTKTQRKRVSASTRGQVAAPVVERVGPTSYREAMALGERIPEGSSGPWRVERFTVDDKAARLDRRTGRGRGVSAGTYTRLIDSRAGMFGDPMMSDTPAEMRDHAWAWMEARSRGGRILVHGLGLGMVAQAMLALPNVDHVDIVELDPDVIALVAPSFQADVDEGRLTIHQGDCFTKEWPKDAHWSVAWSDIWAEISQANLPEMAQLRRRFNKRVCDWHGCWCREFLLDQRRREQRYGYGY
jgi:hypothetical protein